MAGEQAIVRDECIADLKIDFEDLEKILSVVVKRRKTFPAKYMDLHKREAHFQLLTLENAKVITEENNHEEEFRKIIQEFRNQKSVHFTLDDINEMKEKLVKYHKRIDEINGYLEKRNMTKLIYQFNFDL